jgi:hypothetical protein
MAWEIPSPAFHTHVGICLNRSDKMNSVTMVGVVAGAATITRGLNNRTKVVFTLEIDGKGTLLPFNCIAYGPAAEVAGDMYDGDRVLLTGRIIADNHRKSMLIIANAIEILTLEPEDEDEAAPQPQPQ